MEFRNGWRGKKILWIQGRVYVNEDLNAFDLLAG